MNQHQFFTGEIFDAYRWFGAHIEQTLSFPYLCAQCQPHYADRRVQRLDRN